MTFEGGGEVKLVQYIERGVLVTTIEAVITNKNKNKRFELYYAFWIG